MLHVPQAEYKKRRQHLLSLIDSKSIVIISSAPVCQRNADVEYSYRQESNFQYLTGFPEPEALAVFIPQRQEGEYILFCRDRDPAMELWTGRRAGQEGATTSYQADQAFSINEIADWLPKLLDGCHEVYSLMEGSEHQVLQGNIQRWVEQVRAKVRQDAQPPHTFKALEPLLHEMRLRKSNVELAVMQYAMDLSAKAHISAMQACKEGLCEYHLEAALDYTFKSGGARLVAYNSIVASGHNGCILHYQDNNASLKQGDLVMIDAGCEVDCYASDISRTFPVSGQFSEAQKALYEVVLEANLVAISQVKPNVPYQCIHDAAVKVITAGLVKLGLLQGEVDTLIANKAYMEFYMHGTGHWLGLDVHDVGAYRLEGRSRLLEEGMVMTIEPGIYVAPDNKQVDERWRGIGIRIEDNVVVTANGCRVMTSNVPKTIAEIEVLMTH